MKQLIISAENFIDLFTVIGFQLSKGINKIFYALIFSSFEEHRGEQIKQKNNLTIEINKLEAKKKIFYKEKKQYKKKIFLLNKLQYNNHRNGQNYKLLQGKLDILQKEFNRTKIKLMITQKELTKRRDVANITNGLHKAIKDTNGNKKDLLKIEYLYNKIITLKKQIKILTNSKNIIGENIKTKMIEINEPIFIKSNNPFIFINNWFIYRKELSVFNKLVNSYINLDKSNANNSTVRYKFDSLNEHDRSIELGDKYIRIYYLKDIPNYLVNSTLFKLINIPIPLTLSYHIRGTNKSAMIKAARQRLSVLESSQNERLRNGSSRNPEVDREEEEVNEFINDLVHDIERVFEVSLYAMIVAESKNELLQYDKKFEDEAQNIEFIFNVYSFGQQKILPAILPLSNDSVKEDRLLQTSAISNLLPFLTRNLNDPEGIFLGTNHYNGSLVLIDPFKARNANYNIFGTSGSGKSVTAKLLMTRLILRGVQNIIIDPEGEYTKLVEVLGGESIQLKRGSGINPFYIGSILEDDIKDHILILKHFFKFFIQANRYDSAKLDKLLIETYHATKTPTFDTFMQVVKTAALIDNKIRFVEDLEQFVSGSLSGLFNSHRPVKLNSDLIVFDLSQLGDDEKKIPTMYLLSAIIKRIIFDKSNRRRRMIWIDESHKLLRDTHTINFYIDLVKTARKYMAGVVSITQNPEDFRDENNAKTIITQAETTILLKQSPASINYIKNKELFMLTSKELADLPTFGIGEVLFIREKEHIFMNITPFESEKSLIFTN